MYRIQRCLQSSSKEDGHEKMMQCKFYNNEECVCNDSGADRSMMK